MIRIALCITYAVFLAGCVSHPVNASYSRSYPDVFAAAKEAVSSCSDVEADMASGVITSSWGPGVLAPKVQGLLQDRPFPERVRYEIHLSGHESPVSVNVTAHVQRKAPGGPRSLRWERVPSEGRYEAHLLFELEKVLKGATK